MSLNKNSLLIHGGIDGDETTGAVNVPIYQTSTYKQDGLGKTRGGWEYSRTGNPTRAALEKLIADLEEGTHGLAFASGLAAINTVLSLFKSGDRLIVSDNIYGGTFRILDNVFKNFGITYTIVNTSDLAAVESELQADVKDEIKAVYIETPANPLLTVTDIEAVSKLAHKYEKKVIVDNTFLTPYLQRPLTLGADIVVHSGTKYLGGHSDTVSGFVIVKDDALAERLYYLQNAIGGVLAPWDSYLIIRGIKTLGVRMENAKKIAEWLVESGYVEKVYYPGLKEDPGYEVQQKQADGPGAMISFVLKKEYDYKKFFENLKLITLAESLGGVESLVCHPASMTHAAIPREIRQKVGIVDELIRFSVGIEDADDLIKDLEQAILSA